MVLESLMNPFKAEKEPWEMFFIGLLYSSIALFLSAWIFRQQSSLVTIFLTVLAAVPLIYNTIKFEEKKDLFIEGEKKLLREHLRALSFISFLFLGFTISFAFWYVVLPNTLVNDLFSVQTQTIVEINNKVTGNWQQSLNLLGVIFLNNTKVLIFCLLFAFLYGVGAIFILTWNASVIGVAIGNFIRTGINKASTLLGFDKAAKYFHSISIGLLKYSIHGIPEILAYITAGLAGSIISIAVIRHDFGTKKFENILLDSSSLIIISLCLLILAAILEVFVTPVIF